MRQFWLVLLVIVTAIIIIGIYSGVIGKILKAQPDNESPDPVSLIKGESGADDSDLITQQVTAEDIREEQKRLIEERKSRLKDFQRKH